MASVTFPTRTDATTTATAGKDYAQCFWYW